VTWELACCITIRPEKPHARSDLMQTVWVTELLKKYQNRCENDKHVLALSLNDQSFPLTNIVYACAKKKIPTKKLNSRVLLNSREQQTPQDRHIYSTFPELPLFSISTHHHSIHWFCIGNTKRINKTPKTVKKKNKCN
jgi:hypothetical protein